MLIFGLSSVSGRKVALRANFLVYPLFFQAGKIFWALRAKNEYPLVSAGREG